MTVRILRGDCRDVLATLPAESVHCVVTSPPYWGLRDYGIAPSVWGGDPACGHKWGEGLRLHKGGPHGKGVMLEGGRSVVEAQASTKDVDAGAFCRCGAWRGAHGLEPTIDLYVRNAVEIFRAVHRVLRPDGTLWLNLGDSYTSTAQGTFNAPERITGGAERTSEGNQARARFRPITGLKPKDLCGIPWRVAFALQADGWWLRQDIIWAKPNPMPESVTDRCTKAHEYLFLFAKGQWSGRPVKLANLSDDRGHLVRSFDGSSADSWAARFGVGFATSILNSAEIKQQLGGTALEPQVWQQSLRASGSISVSDLPPMHRLARYASRFLNADATAKEFLCEIHRIGLVLGERNDFLIRGCNTKIALPPSVNANGKGAVAIHDAGKIGEFDFVHGEVIVGAPTTCKYFYDAEAIKEPVTQSTIDRVSQPTLADQRGSFRVPGKTNGPMKAVDHGTTRNKRSVWEVATQPFSDAHFATFPPDLIIDCIKAGSPKGGTILDPFGGSGTTGLVADRLQRNAILIELNPDYAAMAQRRLERDAPLLSDVAREAAE